MEAVKYVDGKPSFEDGLIADAEPLRCRHNQCNAEYRIHYSNGEMSLARLDDYRSRAVAKISDDHPVHLASFTLSPPSQG